MSLNQNNFEYRQARLTTEVVYNLKIPVLQNWFYENDYTEEAELLFGTDITFYTDEFIKQLKDNNDNTISFTNTDINIFIYNKILKDIVISY